MDVVRLDVVEATGLLQLSGGQQGGCEAAIHALREVFQDTDAVLFVDASNAFNNLSRFTALYNIQSICPTVSKVLTNCYRADACLFICWRHGALFV